MENWGIVTYRESILLADEATSSFAHKLGTAHTVCHELAHQWFGNLVTMEWWTELWLNEGFARFMEHEAMHDIFPQWNVWANFVQDPLALTKDAMASSHPIEVVVHHPDEIDQVFDVIAYRKGAAVIRMLANFVGNDKFYVGIHNYLVKFAYGNAKTIDLWHALEAASGALPNHKLLTLYGFVLPSNPFDVVELWAPMHEDVPSYDRKLALLTAHGLAEHATSTPFDLYSDSVNDELLASLRIQRLSDTELSQFESGTPHFAFEPIHDDNEKDTLTALIYALQQMLAAFPTAVEDDEAELAARQEGDDEQETGDEASHHVMALHLRVSDKRILHAQIDMLQELLLPVLARLNLASQD
ncbi:hypothetical protein DYB26_015310 [Aphanomyces astaci]|uniref:Peptidase M1 membrane alanine aminopeptidase domain-containing protein n=1 Tax=Aphanomyces astaci TaxID=112090 RepID=A0A418E826_APHAT|nr:hypothetical protein DYB26_015310 [Aphanomyces astaci]